MNDIFYYIKKSLIYLKERLFDAIINKDMEEFNEVNTGKYISIISNDVKIVEEVSLIKRYFEKGIKKMKAKFFLGTLIIINISFFSLLCKDIICP
ncbi:hypothetical protein [Thermoanaerobacter italicus]|uniref:hypothetical protein n=1 Tax=Thermoanaerobacter italicus TaxID=108150 RepID=UPI0001B0E46C|nr:hypothetical protein [Thermoanaerobacter italicus]